MELGQYRSRSGRRLDTAKSSNGSRTVRGRSIFFSLNVDANRTLANDTLDLESGSQPEQVWTRL